MTASTLSILDDFPPVDLATWRAVVDKDLGGAPFDKRLCTPLYEGVVLQPLYRRDDAIVPAEPYPGQGTMVRGGSARPGWEIRQVQAHPCPRVANGQLLTDLGGGCGGLTLRWHPEARRSAVNADPAQVGDGIHCDRLADLERVLDGVELGWIGLGLDAGAAAAPAAIQLLALAERRGIDRASWRLAVNADPLGTLAETGCLPGGVGGQADTLAGLVRHVEEALPAATVLAVSTRAYHEAGASAVQELAALGATGVAYLREFAARGLSAATVARRCVLQMPVGCDQFTEIAKLRAARMIWSRILEACGVEPEAIRLEALPSRRMLTRYDPWVNMLRSTVSCFSAAVGGADVIGIAPFDRRLGPADTLAARVARNTQVILAEEAHLDRVADPGGGSWYLEHLTADLAAAGWAEFQRIEAEGGMLAVLRNRSFRDAIKEVWAQRSRNIDKRKDPITGVSEYPNVAETLPERQVPTVAQLKACVSADGGSDAAVALEALQGGDDIAGAIAAAAAGADLSDLTPALLRGDDDEIKSFSPHHFAEGYEALRDNCGAMADPPTVFLANWGPIAKHTARASYAQNFFEAGGFQVITNEGFTDADDCLAAYRTSGAGIAVICSSDDLYPECVPQLAPALKTAGAHTLVLAGRPGEQEDAWRAAGIDRFIHLGCPVLSTLTDLAAAAGVPS